MLFYILLLVVYLGQATEVDTECDLHLDATACGGATGCVWSTADNECEEAEVLEPGEVEETEIDGPECETNLDQNACVAAGCTWLIEDDGEASCQETEVEEAETEEVDPETEGAECGDVADAGACAETTGCAWEAEESECVEATDIEAGEGAETETEFEETECELLDQTTCGSTNGCSWIEGEGCEETEINLRKPHQVTGECDGLQEQECSTQSGCMWEKEDLEGECIESSDADATDAPETEVDATDAADATECDASQENCQACGGVWTQDTEEPNDWECERNDAGEGLDCDASPENCQTCGGTWSVESEADGESEGDCSGVVDTQETETEEEPEAPEAPEAPETPEEPSLSKPHQTTECGDLLEAQCASDANCSWEIENDSEGECISNSDVEPTEIPEVDENEPTEIPEAGETTECDISAEACSGCGGTWVTDNEGESDCEIQEAGEGTDCDLNQTNCQQCGGTWSTDVEGEGDCTVDHEGETPEVEEAEGAEETEVDEVEAGSCEGLDEPTCGSTTGCLWVVDGLEAECEGEGTEPTLKKASPGTHYSRDVDNYILGFCAFFGGAVFSMWAVQKVMKGREETDIIDLDSFSSHSDQFNYEAFV